MAKAKADPRWKTDPAAAYSEAQRWIAEWEEGDLDFYQLHALDRLPPEIESLSSLTKLLLGLGGKGCAISDLTPLQGLTSLQTLRLDSTQVSDLAPLQVLTSLQTLTLNSTQVSDLAPLQGLTSLQTLDLDNTQVSDLAPLQGLTSLQRLYLNNTQVSDLTPLQGLTSLQTLSLDSTQVSDLTPLQGLTSLQTLSLNRTQVSDLRPIRDLTGLIDGAKDESFKGLYFKNCAATRADPELKRLSEIGNNVERTEATLAYLRTLPDPQSPRAAAEQLAMGRLSGVTADGRVGFVGQFSATLTDAAKQLRDIVLEDLSDAFAACQRQDDNIHGALGDMLSDYQKALTGDPDRIDAGQVYRLAKKLRRIDRAEQRRAGSDFEECHYKAEIGTALEDVVRSHNAFASQVPDLIAKDRAGIDPAERPGTGAVATALPVLDAAIEAKTVFDGSPLVLRQEMRIDPPRTGPEERDQTEDLASLYNLVTVAAAVGLAERKNADPAKLAEATKPGKAPTEFSKGFWAAAGAGTFATGGIGAAAFVSAYEAQLIAFASKMPGSEALIQLIKYVAAFI